MASPAIGCHAPIAATSPEPSTCGVSLVLALTSFTSLSLYPTFFSPLSSRRCSTRPTSIPTFLPFSSLILLRHKFLRGEPLPAGVAQHGHRERVLTSAMINLLRIVAIELGTWRSVLGGGASGSIIFGNGKFFEPSGVTRS